MLRAIAEYYRRFYFSRGLGGARFTAENYTFDAEKQITLTLGATE